MTLDKIIAEANALEAVNRQLEHFGDGQSKNQEINKVDFKLENMSNRYQIDKSVCSRCGNRNHNSRDSRCPAREKIV